MPFLARNEELSPSPVDDPDAPDADVVLALASPELPELDEAELPELVRTLSPTVDVLDDLALQARFRLSVDCLLCREKEGAASCNGVLTS